MSIDEATREAGFPHITFGTTRERISATEVSAYLRALPTRVHAKCERDHVDVYALPEQIGVSWADIASLADGQILGAFQLLLVQHWLGDVGHGPLPTPQPPARPPALPAPRQYPGAGNPVPTGLPAPPAPAGQHRATLNTPNTPNTESRTGETR